MTRLAMGCNISALVGFGFVAHVGELASYRRDRERWAWLADVENQRAWKVARLRGVPVGVRGGSSRAWVADVEN